ncbi:glutamine ABC transporter substrate-binding protein GlnH [Sporolactobacillus pectinivorans]|uniref:glutamine ABC transporter substrate-binding protein GlnH n=1 Tax=Sporolactobacillus pectinivorans TaxID=1591408 RepID=UPI000C25FE30|nr:glutamine ABC transporter substrate-binding protein GlnH [Sporolactobacillus pectinivorans]
MNRHLKKITLCLLSIVVLTGIVGCSNSGSSSSSSKQEAETINVGTDTSFVPFEYLDQKTNKYVGFDMDLLKALSKQSKVKYQLSTMDFNGLLPALQTGKLDMVIAGVTITNERKKTIDFSTPYYNSGFYILVRKNEKNITNFKSLKGKVVATKQGTSALDYINTNLKDAKKIVPFPNIDQAYMDLLNGSADAVIFDAPNIDYYIKTEGNNQVKKVGELLDGQQYGIAYPKNSKLTKKMDVALKALMDNGTYSKIYKKWFGTEPPKIK